MKAIEELNETIYDQKIAKEAKERTRKELEKVYTTVKKEYETRVNEAWRFVAIISIFGILCSVATVVAHSVQYNGSEFENYETFAEDICYKEELGNLRSFQIAENEIKVKCYGGEYEITK